MGVGGQIWGPGPPKKKFMIFIVTQFPNVKSENGSVVYFGLLLDKSTVGVAESEQRVWPLQPPGRSFLPYSGLHCRRIAHGRLEMLSIRKPAAPNPNLQPESTVHKPEVLSKVPELVRNIVELIVIRKTRVKSRRGQT